MVDNKFVQCNVCSAKINIRIQVGFYDIPFHMCCPNCHSTIHGKIYVEENHTDIVNAHITNCDNEEFYSVELSAEFPTRKIIYKNSEENELSPYMRNLNFYGNGEKAIKETQKAMYFANFVKSDWDDFKRNFELFWNNQEKILFKRIKNMIAQYPHIPLSKINNNLDAAMALHQLLLTTTGIANVISKNSLHEYSEIGNLVVGKMDHFAQIANFLETNQIDFNIIEKKGFNLIELFTKVYEQLIPVVALKNGDCLDNVDKKQYGIMTANFDELTDFYAKSYEWILENIIIIVGLNNIYVRNDSMQCSNGKTYANFLRESKGNRLKNGYIDEREPFSKPINSLNNRVRNAIQHFDSNIDYVTQQITFNDRNSSANLYLMDLADLCIENFCLIFYILELVYNLRKLSFIREGVVPSFFVKEPEISISQHKIKKIGRNEPCSCGSGNKYKRCCGK